VSVGHVARAAEAVGISTVSIFVRSFRHVAEQMTLSRTVITRNPMGRPLGAPGDAERHGHVVRTALGLLERAQEAGTIYEMDEPFRAGRWGD
jgi:hypothetical protein